MPAGELPGRCAPAAKNIAIAVKSGGTSPDGNPALRRALQNARALNMPKDKVETAIKKASGQNATSYDIIIYEGYAPHGIAVLVEADPLIEVAAAEVLLLALEEIRNHGIVVHHVHLHIDG